MAVIFLTKVATFGFVGDDRTKIVSALNVENPILSLRIALDKPGSHCMLSTSGTA